MWERRGRQLIGALLNVLLTMDNGGHMCLGCSIWQHFMHMQGEGHITAMLGGFKQLNSVTDGQ